MTSTFRIPRIAQLLEPADPKLELLDRAAKRIEELEKELNKTEEFLRAVLNKSKKIAELNNDNQTN